MPGARLFAGTRDGFPQIVFPLMEQEKFDPRAGIDPCAVQPCGHDARIVEDQAVAGAQIVGNIIEMAVFDRAGIFINDHHAGAVARFDGGLRDQFRGQVVKEITFFHLTSSESQKMFDLHIIGMI